MTEDHNEKVEQIRSLFRRLCLPNLPPHLVHLENYHPDLCTRIKNGFVILDVINSEGQFNFDIGGLTTLIISKDIIDHCIAVVANSVYPEVVKRIQKYRNTFLDKLVILNEHELEDWLRERISSSALWSPRNTVVVTD